MKWYDNVCEFTHRHTEREREKHSKARIKKKQR